MKKKDMKKKVKKRTSVDRPFNDGTMSAAEFRSLIISALRNASRFWKPKMRAIKEAHIGRNQYKCELCGKIGPASLPPLPGKKRKRKNILRDHISRIVPPEEGFTTYDRWIERCFVEREGFQAICRECHSGAEGKTKKENLARKK